MPWLEPFAKPHPEDGYDGLSVPAIMQASDGNWYWYEHDYPEEGTIGPYQCPFGQLGDRLWIRETWGIDKEYEYTLTMPEYDGGQNPAHILYKVNDPHPETFKWRPAIHLPHWASRIILEIVNIRVERIQDITEADAIAEGVSAVNAGQDANGPIKTHRTGFVYLWNKLNAKKGYGWEVNPFVWVIEFKRIGL